MSLADALCSTAFEGSKFTNEIKNLTILTAFFSRKMDTLKKLSAERDEIDRKLADQHEILKANNSTMDSPLVDPEGFPIASIDVYAVRYARVEIIRLLNDRKELEKQILAELEATHENEGKEENHPAQPKEEYPIVHRTSNNPFMKVADVIPGSPAYMDGLKQGDAILQWGSLHYDVFTNMKEVADSSVNSENKVLRVTVLRNGRAVRLEIIPRHWDGNGLLGCKLESLKS